MTYNQITIEFSDMRDCNGQKRIWIAWEKQRRSIELSKSFGCDLFFVIESGILRYPISVIKTYNIIKRERPNVIFVQNPSMVLAVLSTCLIKVLFKCHVIVDRHSNFLLVKKKRVFLFELLFQFLSYLSIKFADLTIVTNKELYTFIDILGGKVMVLPDKIPQLIPSKEILGLKRKKNILFISSFADDEPIHEMSEAAAEFSDEDIMFYFSGNYKKYKRIEHISSNENIILTGFLSDNDYIDVLHAVDIVIVLTTMKYTLLCGCYEAIAASKVLITSDTPTLKELFDSAVLVKNQSNEIAKGIRYALMNEKVLKEAIVKMEICLNQKWEEQFQRINILIEMFN